MLCILLFLFPLFLSHFTFASLHMRSDHFFCYQLYSVSTAVHLLIILCVVSCVSAFSSLNAYFFFFHASLLFSPSLSLSALFASNSLLFALLLLQSRARKKIPIGCFHFSFIFCFLLNSIVCWSMANYRFQYMHCIYVHRRLALLLVKRAEKKNYNSNHPTTAMSGLHLATIILTTFWTGHCNELRMRYLHIRNAYMHLKCWIIEMIFQ